MLKIALFSLLFSPLSWSAIEFRDSENRYAGELRFRIQNLAEFSENRNSWQVRRLRLRSKGWAGTPDLTYSLQLSFSRSDMDWDNTEFPNIVRDAVIAYRFSDALQLRFGQTKLPGNRQRVISSGQQQFADRSIVNRMFNLDRDFGFFIDTGFIPQLNLQVSLTTGEGRNLPQSSNAGLAHVIRASFTPKPFLNSGEEFEGDLEFEPELKTSLGLSYGHFRDSFRQNGAFGRFMRNPDSSLARRTLDVLYADALWKWLGMSLYLEAVKRWVVNPQVSSSVAYYPGYGYLIQAGKMLDQQNEIAFRRAFITPDASVKTVSDPQLIEQLHHTLGFTHYFSHHRVKIQADLTHELNRTFYNQRLGVAWSGRLNFELGI